MAANRSFHPVRNYLKALPPWDGVERVDTLLVTYLGADDNIYTRAVTRKTLVAAIARVMRPGIKFDQVLILNGPQGVGKSTLFAKLAGEWFSDALTMTDMKDKTGAEKLQGHWIIEIGELSGMRKMEVEIVKSFISRTDDKYRPAYASVVESHPRQCIIVGTTNAEDGFLRDITGNRRFSPVKVTGVGEKKAWEVTDEEVKQIWAEALTYYKAGEPLHLTGEVAELARVQQDDAIETDDRVGLVADFLEKKLPADWDMMPLHQRRAYLSGASGEFGMAGVTDGVERATVTNPEIWAECFGNEPAALQRKDSYEIASIMKQIKGWERSESRERVPLYGRQRVYRRKAPGGSQ
ncbi:virulence-associated E family protein [Corynebacterium glucuronolyticum]|uniref:virulence-associated E family protein n=1 Tax=Corynebacterium glucuronolyticum TaxID=39791 RepID=UPI001E4592B6|nr:virulence-associated E family protein [Corynebacterium glucuronolyticum]